MSLSTAQQQSQSDIAVLVNISAEKWPPRHRTYFGSLEVRSPESGETYALTPVRGCKGSMDLGDKRSMDFPISAREIAEDIARVDIGKFELRGVRPAVPAFYGPTNAACLHGMPPVKSAPCKVTP